MKFLPVVADSDSDCLARTCERPTILTDT